MNKLELNQTSNQMIDMGHYRIKWKADDSWHIRYSEAFIGKYSDGSRWIHPSNWIKPVKLDTNVIRRIDCIEKIDI